MFSVKFYFRRTMNNLFKCSKTGSPIVAGLHCSFKVTRSSQVVGTRAFGGLTRVASVSCYPMEKQHEHSRACRHYSSISCLATSRGKLWAPPWLCLCDSQVCKHKNSKYSLRKEKHWYENWHLRSMNSCNRVYTLLDTKQSLTSDREMRLIPVVFLFRRLS